MADQHPGTHAAAALDLLAEADQVFAEAVHAKDMTRLDRTAHLHDAATVHAILAAADAIADLTATVRSTISPPGAPRRPF